MKNIATILIIGIHYASTAYAQVPQWSSIFATDDSGDRIAGVSSDDAKSYLALRCFKALDMCALILKVENSCKEGVFYPMLANTGRQSINIDGLCTHTNLGYEYVLKPYQEIVEVIYTDNGFIGFATPLESGLFKAYRFSLQKAKTHMDIAFRAISSKNTPNQYNSHTF